MRVACFPAVFLALALAAAHPAPGGGRLSPSLRRQLRVLGIPHPPGRSAGKTGQGFLDVIVQTDDPGILSRAGIQVRSFSGDVATVSASPDQIAQMQAMPGVSYIDAPAVCRPSLDVSTDSMGLIPVHSGVLGRPYTGAGVILGFCDSGIDWRHPDFRRTDGSSRILFIWDQTDDSGPAPSGYGYGSEYDSGAINAAIGGAGDVRGRDFWGHGTHVAGIAAGNGRGSGNGRPAGVYVGVAPDADLIIVKSGDGEFLSNYIMDGVDYIFKRAQDYDASRPVAVNLSVGTHLGPHDGTSLFERFMDQQLNGQGRAVIVASGNEGNKAVHAEAYLEPDSGPDTVQVQLHVPENAPGTRDAVRLDIWAARHAEAEVSIRTPGGQVLGPVPSGGLQEWDTAEGHIYADNASGGMYPNNGDVEILVDLEDSAGGGGHSDNLAAGGWRLEFRGKAGRLDAWIYQSTTGDAAFTNHAVYSTLVAEPGNAYSVITVGAYVTRTEWPSLLADPWGPGGLETGRLSASSSPGPTRPGDFFPDTRRKPEITATGEFIVSSLSSFKTIPVSGYMTASDSFHHAWNGTIMAAPHVTGLAALLFESNPGLDPVDIQNAIVSTARHDGLTGEVWNPSWGFGKCDGLEAMRKTSVDEDAAAAPPGAFRTAWNYPNPFNGSTVLSVRFAGSRRLLSGPVRITVMDVMGRRIRTLPASCTGDGLCRAVWDARDGNGIAVPSGIYVFGIRELGGWILGKMILAR